MLFTKIIAGLAIAGAMLPGTAFGESLAANTAVPVQGQAQAKAPAQAPVGQQPQFAQIQPYRTYITVQSYVMDNNGDPKNPISNVRLEVAFPGEKKFELPEGGQYWPIGNGQKQDIARTYELPWQFINNDGFEFTVQMVRKGGKMLPCKFKVTQLSQYNRGYFCHTDVQWQYDQKVAEEKLDKEGVQIRVFTDKNTPAKELPKDALALK